MQTWRATYSVPLREEPSTSSEKLRQVPRNTTLRALEQRGEWLRAEYDHDGETVTGWVNTGFISQA
ncbi:SH3 domain-containing protein [Nesterenkonia flava]|uniref:SH3 domain-containing protein n=1 Tax=Nesterenkonia flava TaxID=469799 RepID=A0ABU1FT85_9MICC|nr:SH3 domain-containing protein [Nesterenkonia flava]MDR5711880.1 SH3 domain-containing protein [Nesterenkonia flava]